MTPSDSERLKLDPVTDLGLPPPAPVGFGAPATIGLTSAPTLPANPGPRSESESMSFLGVVILLVFGAAVLWYVLRKTSEDSGLAESVEKLDDKLKSALERLEDLDVRLGVTLEVVAENGQRANTALEKQDAVDKKVETVEARTVIALENMELFARHFAGLEKLVEDVQKRQLVLEKLVEDVQKRQLALESVEPRTASVEVQEKAPRTRKKPRNGA